MPRVTRAQLRAREAEGGPQIIHEDSEETPTTITEEYDPFSTEVPSRPPLSEIQNIHTAFPESDLTEQLTPTKKGRSSNKGKFSRQNNINLILANSENSLAGIDQEVLEDESQSEGSSAAEIAAEALRREDPVSETFQVPIDTARLRTPPSTAAKEASMSLSRSPEKRLIAVQGSVAGTPRFDPVVHTEMPSASEAAGQRCEDSFVGSIKTRTPARMVTSEQHAGDGPDSFVEDIISRSPSKYVARIEDSVEAIDALEEAIEQVAKELPKAMAEGLESPVKISTPRGTTAIPSPKQAISASAASSRQALKRSALAARSPSATKTPAPSKAATRKPVPRVSSARPQARPSILTTIKPRSSTQLTASTTTAKPSPPAPTTTTTTRAPKRTTSTSLSTSKPGFVPNKSAKLPTKSNFTLPGDAISAKMKAQREERLKKEEEAKAEAARKRTEFKARPVPKPTTAAVGTGKGRVTSVLPRETAASRARMSLMAARKDEDGKGNIGPTPKKVVAGSGLGSLRAGSGSSARKSIRPSTTAQSGLSITKTRPRPSVANASATAGRGGKKSTVPANSSAVRRNTTNLAPSAKARQSSIQSTAAPLKTRQSSIQTTAPSGPRSGSDSSSRSKPPVATAPTTTAGKGTTRGKEVFSRGKLAEEDLLKQKREKEDAARRARAEAAERGRLASREWAEKQKKRKTMVVMGKVLGLKDAGVQGVAVGVGAGAGAGVLMGDGEIVG